MVKIMFVCHGNICRSPMAEFIMKDIVRKAGMEKSFLIASSATSTEEIWGDVGNPVYPPARRELMAHGISCEGKTAVQIKKSDYSKWDMIICMDTKNLRNLHRIFGGDPEGKISKLMNYAGSDADVSDPWYTGDFKGVYEDILKGCESLLVTLSR
ncbi:MAG: low molecular weight phosphotyrosine protein phosphatase [Clostridia bacterium]|nr:low molecular weight phosphotyrosine protein phosphatase [Clostridia bacterium]